MGREWRDGERDTLLNYIEAWLTDVLHGWVYKEPQPTNFFSEVWEVMPLLWVFNLEGLPHTKAVSMHAELNVAGAEGRCR